MKTDDLISALTADLPHRPTPVSRALLIAAAAGIPIALAILMLVLHPRDDFWQALASPRFLYKFVFALSVAAAGSWLVLRLSRPGATAGPARFALVGAFAGLFVAVVSELFMLPGNAWLPALIGDRAVACMLLIPTLAAAPFAALMYAMKAGAPDSPRAAGAATGLLAGAIGATFYAAHCTNDSPLFVAVWYVIGISAVTVLGSVVGARLLRW